MLKDSEIIGTAGLAGDGGLQWGVCHERTV